MNYEEFKEQFPKAVEEGLNLKGHEVNLKVEHVNKPNSQYDSMVVSPFGKSIAININMENFYKEVENGTDFGEMVAAAINTAEKGLREAPEIDYDVINKYEKMKDQLVMEVVSSEANAELLENIPHKEMEDMSVIYRVLVTKDEEAIGSIVVTNDLLKSVGVSADQLHQDALENAPKLKPAEIVGMSEIMIGMMGEDMAKNMGIVPMKPEDEKMYVASTHDRIQGASVLAYQGFFDQAADKLGGSFFVLPSSVHEIILVPEMEGMSASELKQMVTDINAEHVEAEDKLTDNVYHYDSKEKVFELGEAYVDRQALKESMEKENLEEKDSLLSDLKAKKDEVSMKPINELKDKAVQKNKGGEAI